MPSSPSSPTESPWVADPVRDFLCYRLVMLAVAVLDVAFADDGIDKEYRRWQKSARRKPRSRALAAGGPDNPASPAEPLKEIRSWERPGGYTVRVLAQLKWGEFVVVIEEEDFRAEIMAIYDIDAFEVTAAGVESFAGDAVRAIEVAHRFVLMLEEVGLDLDEPDLEFASAPLAGGTPESAVIEIGHRVELIADRVAAGLSGRPGDGLGLEDEHFLATTPAALWAIRDGFIARTAGGVAVESKALLAWQTLLEKQLEEIRFKAERKHAWALEMIDRYQSDLLTMAKRPGVDINTWQALVIALDRAKIGIRPDVRAASLDLAAGVAGRGPAAADIMRSMEEIVESGGGDPFRIAHHLFDAMTMMPPDFANAGVMMVSEAPLPALRDVLPLVLLAPEAACRQAAAAALEQMAAEKRLTPSGLRRLIALRSWLPEGERPTIDQAIRKARLAGVDCAPWPAGQVRALKATVIDGSGCQSLVALARDDRRTLFTGILTKQGFGVRDVILERGLARRDAEAMLASVADRVLTLAVTRPYLDRMVQHALWTGVSAGRMPPLELLEVAETLGAGDWRAQRLDAGAELEQLLSELPAGQATPAARIEALRRSAEWLKMPALADSWFEDDESARALCLAHGRNTKKLIPALLAEVIEPRRGIWAERLVWMALWTRAGGGGPGLPAWSDYARVAQALYAGAPLTEVPLMTAIAKLTAGHLG
ncbi:MAG: hypothetical protein WCO00_03065 [Rhodospirillaceae bacterium]